jgi:2',3'-cyclic-nucleotide 2'-phosphodiesterase (5'-nucleotidase family)
MNVLTDEVRALTKADVALLNTGGVRANIKRGEVVYEQFFRVLPFSNHAVMLGPMPTASLLEILKRSVQTCGSYGAILQSGLRVTFRRHCSAENGGVDKNARLIRVALLDGEVLFDESSMEVLPAKSSLIVATFDFLASGGDGFTGFSTAPLIRDFGILREVLTEKYVGTPFRWRSLMDGRWQQLSGG